MNERYDNMTVGQDGYVAGRNMDVLSVMYIIGRDRCDIEIDNVCQAVQLSSETNKSQNTDNL